MQICQLLFQIDDGFHPHPALLGLPHHTAGGFAVIPEALSGHLLLEDLQLGLHLGPIKDAP